MQQNTAVLTEQEIMNDALSSEKQIISAYGTFLAESTCENLRSEMTKILNDKQQIQYEIFNAMQQKGWYNVKNANMNDVQTATQKFQTMQQNMQQ
ncbi:MAG: spore coat protein [Acetivibrionales bacterium]|jgi:spore coat protein F|nr:spore coat protein [Clostridiaceae bacterium]